MKDADATVVQVLLAAGWGLLTTTGMHHLGTVPGFLLVGCALPLLGLALVFGAVRLRGDPKPPG